MVAEVLEALAPRSDGRYVDATVGLGGHAECLLDAASGGAELLGIDRDLEALAKARSRLARFGERVRLVHGELRSLKAVVADAGWADGVDGVLLDLGVSSLQLDSAERGFSFPADGPLDMRMDRAAGLDAPRSWSRPPRESELADIDLSVRRGAGVAPHRARDRSRPASVSRSRPPPSFALPCSAPECAAGPVMIRAHARSRRFASPSTASSTSSTAALEEGWRLLRPGPHGRAHLPLAGRPYREDHVSRLGGPLPLPAGETRLRLRLDTQGEAALEPAQACRARPRSRATRGRGARGSGWWSGSSREAAFPATRAGFSRSSRRLSTARFQTGTMNAPMWRQWVRERVADPTETVLRKRTLTFVIVDVVLALALVWMNLWSRTWAIASSTRAASSIGSTTSTPSSSRSTRS